MEVKPAVPINPAIQGGTTPLDAAMVLIDEEWKKKVKEWKQGEAVVKQQIVGTIPDLLFLKICSKGTA